MSERTHSPQVAAASLSRRSLFPILAGTAMLLVAAAIWLQFFRAQPAASQANDPQASGRASIESSSGKILAKVNNQAITYDVVARECVARHGQEILDSLINRLIIQQECDRQGITVSKAEVEQEVIETAKKFKLPIDTWYQMLEAERGLTRQQYHDDIIWPMLALKKLAGQQVQVTEDDMKKGFEKHYGPRVKARMILVEGNVRQANQIWEKCEANPDDFDRLARELSADPNTRPLGGVIPPIRKHGGGKEFEQVEKEAFKMKPGEISPVVQIAENRYVILKCEGFTDPVEKDIRVVWNDLLNQLTEEKMQSEVAKVFERIKADARVDNFLTRTSTGKRRQSANPVRQASAVQPAEAQSPVPAQR
jgi:foldase protein PrsA